MLSQEALAFVERLHRELDPERERLLAAREERRGARPSFVRAPEEFSVAPAPPALQDRRVEITGPVDRKMMINALNSGAKVFMADFEDANSPTWDNVRDGQRNVYDAVRRQIELETGEKSYRLNDETATLVIRNRGWHLVERHHLVDGAPISASLFDFGMYLFHSGRAAIEAGSGPYLYLAKLESHHEARLWNDVFTVAEQRLGIPHGTVRATVLIETIPAAFEMDEILYELREHASGLNAGRWDYLFSIIKYFRDSGPEFVLPDRGLIGMPTPFMRAYAELLVQTCHRRGAFAIGGMSAFIPSRKDKEANKRAFAKVREDKQREASQGFDGSWVAHPDLVAVCEEVFDGILGDRPNQLDVLRDDVHVTAEDLLDIASAEGEITRAGLTGNVEVAARYLEAWLGGLGAVGIHNLMEDAATAEISRSQIWQWVHNGSRLDDGTLITAELVRDVMEQERSAIRAELGDAYDDRNFETAFRVLEQVALADDYVDFLTLPAYEAASA